MKLLPIISYCLLALQAGTAQAATPLERLDQALSANTQSVSTLAASPADVQRAAMEAAAYPEVLWEMDREQQRTSQQFQKMIAPYPRKTQEKIYDLVRYPNLIEDMVEGGPKSKDQIKNLSQNLPKGVQDAAKDLGTKEYDLLRGIRELNIASDRDFENSLQKIPEPNRQAYRKLLGHPEVLRALSEDRDLTLALGDAYRSNPHQAEAKLSEFGTRVVQQNEEALGDYRQTLANDPQAREELKNSAKAFAGEYGYASQDDYYPPSSSSSNFSVNININPYPYWFGYPYWASIPIWRPYPLWYYTGFYGWGSSFYVWGLPSYYYTDWFYGYPSHFYNYPYLSSCYSNYYYRTRYRPYYYSGFHRGVNNWYSRQGYRTSQDMWSKDGDSARRWHDYGEREEVRRRRTSSPPAYSQPHERDRQGDSGRSPGDWKDKPGYQPRDNDGQYSNQGRDRGKDRNGGKDPGSDNGRYGKGPRGNRNGDDGQGFKPRGDIDNPKNVPDSNRGGRGPQYGKRPDGDNSGDKGRGFKPRNPSGDSSQVSDANSNGRRSNPRGAWTNRKVEESSGVKARGPDRNPQEVSDSNRGRNDRSVQEPGEVNPRARETAPGFTSVSNRAPENTGSHAFRERSSSFDSGRGRSSWGGGSSSGFRGPSSFGGGSSRGSSFHSGGGSGRGRR